MAVHQQVRRSAVVAASPPRVWEAIRDEHALTRWLGQRVRWDLRPGGSGTITAPDGRHRRVTVAAVEPARRLVYASWPADDEGQPSVVEIALVPSGAKTVVTVTETAVSGPPADDDGGPPDA